MAQPETTARTARGRSAVWWGLVAAALVGGFVDLARGGDTIAPILLVLAYCVLIPLAILK